VRKLIDEPLSVDFVEHTARVVVPETQHSHVKQFHSFRPVTMHRFNHVLTPDFTARTEDSLFNYSIAYYFLLISNFLYTSYFCLAYTSVSIGIWLRRIYRPLMV